MNVKQNISEIIYWVCIFIVSGSMVVYGIAKPIQFDSSNYSGYIKDLNGQQLMWLFYGYSKTYPIIIGIVEIGGAIALLYRKTRLFGCFLLTIILTNIIIQDAIYGVLALSTAVYYQLFIFIILLFDFQKVKNLIQILFASDTKKHKLKWVLIALTIALILKFFETKIVSTIHF